MSAVLAVCASVTAQTIPSTTVLHYENLGSSEFDMATDGTNHFITTVEIINFEGNSEGAGTGDALYTIYDDNFGIMEQFTIKGAYVKTMYNNRVYETNRPNELSVWSYDIPDVLATKGLFTNDNKWCVIIEEHDTDNPYKVVAYSVYNQDGKKVGNLPLTDDNYFYLYFSNGINGKLYLVTSQNLLYAKYSVTIYSFTGQNSLASPAIVARTVRTWPNPLPSGEALTVCLSREAPEGTFITFTDMRGHVVDKTRVQSGADTITATPRSMSRGAYIYTVYFGDGEVVSGKLLAQ